MKYLGTLMIAAMAAAFTATALAPTGSAQDAMSAVKARQDLMKSNGAANGRIAKSDNAKDIADAARTIQGNAQKLKSLWPANSIVGNSRAKPEIWQNMAGFTKYLQDLEAGAGKVLAAANAGNVQGAKDAQKGMGGACGGCHKEFRGPEKK